MVSGVDAVFETVGGDVAMKSFAVLKPGGRAAFIASGGQAPKPPRGDVASLRPAVGRTAGTWSGSRSFISPVRSGRPRSSSTGCPTPSDAQRVSEGRHFRGKLMFKVR